MAVAPCTWVSIRSGGREEIHRSSNSVCRLRVTVARCVERPLRCVCDRSVASCAGLQAQTEVYELMRLDLFPRYWEEMQVCAQMAVPGDGWPARGDASVWRC